MYMFTFLSEPRPSFQMLQLRKLLGSYDIRNVKMQHCKVDTAVTNAILTCLITIIAEIEKLLQFIILKYNIEVYC